MPIPRTSEELAEVMASPAKTKLAVREAGSLENFIRSYASNQAPDVSAQVEQQTELRLMEMARSGAIQNRIPVPMGGTDNSVRKNRLRAALTKGDPNRYNKSAPGAKLDGTNEFRDASFGEIMAAVVKHSEGTASPDQRRMISKMLEIQNSLSSTVPSDGGFLIPEQTRSDILTLALEETIVRQRATVYPMSSLTLGIPTVDDTSHVTNVYGGISFSFTPESGTISASQPRFGKVLLEAAKLAFFTNIPNELMDDAPALNVWLNANLPDAYAWYEDGFFLRGTGVGEPAGVLSAAGRIAVDREGSGTDTISYDDLVNMFSRMLPRSLKNAVWVVSNECIPQLFNVVKLIKNVAGTENVGGSTQQFITTVSGDVPTTIFGRPVIYTEHAEQLGTEGDISFIDFKHYLVGDRMSLQLKTSTDYRFQNDETSVRGIARVDGRPAITTAITPRNGGDTLSPYVTLAN